MDTEAIMNALDGIADPLAFIELAKKVGIPTDCRAGDDDSYLAFYVVDVFDVADPTTAAHWAWDQVRNSHGPVFTVLSASGEATDIDLSEVQA